MFEFVLAIDSLLQAFLPPLARIAVWAAFSGAFSMALYALTSPQRRLQFLKAEHKDVRQTLMRYDGEWNGLSALIRKDLWLSLKQIGLVLGPFVISMTPVIAILLSLYMLYGYRLPVPGEAVTITVAPGEALVNWDPPAAAPGNDTKTWVLSWPDADQPIALHAQWNNLLLLNFPLRFPVTDVYKAHWMDHLIPYPLDTLPDNAPVEHIAIALQEFHFTHFGPDWMRGFEFWYILILLVVSLAIKVKFKII